MISPMEPAASWSLVLHRYPDKDVVPTSQKGNNQPFSTATDMLSLADGFYWQVQQNGRKAVAEALLEHLGKESSAPFFGWNSVFWFCLLRRWWAHIVVIKLKFCYTCGSEIFDTQTGLQHKKNMNRIALKFKSLGPKLFSTISQRHTRTLPAAQRISTGLYQGPVKGTWSVRTCQHHRWRKSWPLSMLRGRQVID